jgi:hypothetical protein
MAAAANAEERSVGSWLRIAAKEKLLRDAKEPESAQKLRQFGTAAARSAPTASEVIEAAQQEARQSFTAKCKHPINRRIGTGCGVCGKDR